MIRTRQLGVAHVKDPMLARPRRLERWWCGNTPHKRSKTIEISNKNTVVVCHIRTLHEKCIFQIIAYCFLGAILLCCCCVSVSFCVELLVRHSGMHPSSLSTVVMPCTVSLSWNNGPPAFSQTSLFQRVSLARPSRHFSVDVFQVHLVSPAVSCQRSTLSGLM